MPGYSKPSDILRSDKHGNAYRHGRFSMIDDRVSRDGKRADDVIREGRNLLPIRPRRKLSDGEPDEA